MMPKISVIVPVYKIESYLRQCVDSILAQTHENLEIILVNDGSPDNCGAICDEYAGADDRVVTIHQENRGVSAARNAGIDAATGEYLTFIDSDDWVESDTLEFLYDNLVKHGADISCCSHYFTYVNAVIPANSESEILQYDSEQAIEAGLIGKEITVGPWGKLYKKRIFDAIRFPLGVKIAEDAFIFADVTSEADRIVIETAPKYYYRQRKSSAINRAFDVGTMDIVRAFEKILRIVEARYANIADTARAQVLNANLEVLRRMALSGNYKKTPEYKEVLTTLRRHYGFAMNSAFFTRNEKIKLTAVKINAGLYKLLQSINDWKKKKITEKDTMLFD